MTELLQRIIAELEKLPDEEQDAIATRLLAVAQTVHQEVIAGDTASEQVTQEALSLPSASRALLAEKLIESLEFDIDSATQAAWTTEAKRRRDEIRSGAVQPVPGEEALAQVRQLLEQ